MLMLSNVNLHLLLKKKSLRCQLSKTAASPHPTQLFTSSLFFIFSSSIAHVIVSFPVFFFCLLFAIILSWFLYQGNLFLKL